MTFLNSSCLLMVQQTKIYIPLRGYFKSTQNRTLNFRIFRFFQLIFQTDAAGSSQWIIQALESQLVRLELNYIVPRFFPTIIFEKYCEKIVATKSCNCENNALKFILKIILGFWMRYFNISEWKWSWSTNSIYPLNRFEVDAPLTLSHD